MGFGEKLLCVVLSRLKFFMLERDGRKLLACIMCLVFFRRMAAGKITIHHLSFHVFAENSYEPFRKRQRNLKPFVFTTA